MTMFLLGAVFGSVSTYLIIKNWPKFLIWVDDEIIAIKDRLGPKR